MTEMTRPQKHHGSKQPAVPGVKDVLQRSRKPVTTIRCAGKRPPARPASLEPPQTESAWQIFTGDAWVCVSRDGSGPMGPAYAGSATTTPFPFSVQFKEMPRKQQEAPLSKPLFP